MFNLHLLAGQKSKEVAVFVCLSLISIIECDSLASMRVCRYVGTEACRSKTSGQKTRDRWESSERLLVTPALSVKTSDGKLPSDFKGHTRDRGAEQATRHREQLAGWYKSLPFPFLYPRKRQSQSNLSQLTRNQTRTVLGVHSPHSLRFERDCNWLEAVLFLARPTKASAVLPQ
jgi:hypothetical protein